MDGIILAGGKGTRMRPLTDHTPKALLDIQGKPLLEWTLRTMRPSVDRVIVVVNHLRDQIEDYMAQQAIFPDYVCIEQTPEPLGTGHALQCCQPYLNSEEFIAINGDDLFPMQGIAELTRHPAAILTLRLFEDPHKYGVAVKDDQSYLIRMHEKPPKGTYSLPAHVNMGAYKFSTTIFEYELALSARGEYEITDYVSLLARDRSVKVVETDGPTSRSC